MSWALIAEISCFYLYTTIGFFRTFRTQQFDDDEKSYQLDEFENLSPLLRVLPCLRSCPTCPYLMPFLVLYC